MFYIYYKFYKRKSKTRKRYKRLYLISEKVNINNIVKNNCMISFKDMKNIDFDNLLKLLLI